MTDYAILVDGERVAGAKTQDDVRNWIVTYRQEHADDDPGATHVQILERGTLAWLTGGKLVDRKQFL
jgi:Fe-S-cluster formation regulator IscX/YfhJ